MFEFDRRFFDGKLKRSFIDQRHRWLSIKRELSPLNIPEPKEWSLFEAQLREGGPSNTQNAKQVVEKVLDNLTEKELDQFLKVHQDDNLIHNLRTESR